ncbi:MAG: VCBS repeat-containing protein [Bacteroidota bacterium]
MLRALPLILLTLGSALPAAAQPFTVQPTNFDDERFSFAAPVFGDYDADGDLDLAFIAGADKVFRNDDGAFVEVADLGGFFRAADWGDVDADGDLDLLVLGDGLIGNGLVLFRNDGGTFTREVIDARAFSGGAVLDAVRFADYDGDGDLDFAAALDARIDGALQQSLVRVYRNDDGAFVDAQVGHPGGESVFWGDVDGDGTPDLFVGGNRQGDTSNDPSYLYRNEGGVFVEVTPVPADPNGEDAVEIAAWGDVDADGDLDLATGEALWLNEGGMLRRGPQFDTFLVPGDLAWGDVDADGDLDLLATGQDGRARPRTVVLINDGGTLTVQDVGLGGAASLGILADVDADGDLDALLQNNTSSGDFKTQLALNSLATPNAAPAAPAAVRFEPSSDTSGTLRWTAATDDTTPPTALRYNLRLGTTPGGQDRIVAQARPDGQRLVLGPGNVGTRTERAFMDLAPCVSYHYGVQALDNGLRGGAFAEGIFATNLAPTVAAAPPALTFTLGEAPRTIALEEAEAGAVFTDYPGDPLSYALSGGDEAIATATLDGSTLTVTPTGAGSTVLTISADDGVCGPTELVVRIRVDP